MKLLVVPNPFTVTKRAVHLTAATVGLAAGLARGTVRAVASQLLGHGTDRASQGDVLVPDTHRVPDVASYGGARDTGSRIAEQMADEARATLPPLPDLEPPVDVVGQALAAEAQGMDEGTAAPDDDVELDDHLTQPLIDPADVQAVAAELQTMSRASDPDKG